MSVVKALSYVLGPVVNEIVDFGTSTAIKGAVAAGVMGVSYAYPLAGIAMQSLSLFNMGYKFVYEDEVSNLDVGAAAGATIGLFMWTPAQVPMAGSATMLVSCASKLATIANVGLSLAGGASVGCVSKAIDAVVESASDYLIDSNLYMPQTESWD